MNCLSNNSKAMFNRHDDLGSFGLRPLPLLLKKRNQTRNKTAWRQYCPQFEKLQAVTTIHETKQWKFLQRSVVSTWQTGKTQTWSHFKVCYLHTKYMDIKRQKRALFAPKNAYFSYSGRWRVVVMCSGVR